MFKTRGESKEEDNKNSQDRENLLVLSIDQNGKIKYFNAECEKKIGYYKNEVLDKKFDFLIPDQYYDQWKKMFEAVKQDKQINDFKLPWLAKDGQKIFISWNIAPVGKENGDVENIGLVGKYIETKDDGAKTFVNKNIKKNDAIYQFGGKRIVIRTNPDINSKKMDAFNDVKTKPTLKFEAKSKTFENESDTSSIKKEKSKNIDYHKLMEKYDSKNLEKTYEDFNKSVRSIRKLEKKNKELEKKNKKLDKKLKKKKMKKPKDKSVDKKQKDVFKEIINRYDKYANFLFDCLGAGKKRKEFYKMIQELDERKEILSDFEDELNSEKRNFNRGRDAFIRWREKLELLEDEIEKRRVELVKQEDKFERKLVESLKQNLRDKSIDELESLISSKGVDQGEIHHEILDKIPQGAVIVQRGILKQINKPFEELIGFGSDELVEKSLFDFIAPEGLSGLEKYYFNRLKGDESSSYDTMFVSNDNKIIPVGVNIKPMVYNGDRADMIVVTGMGETSEAKIGHTVINYDSEDEPDGLPEPPTEEKTDETQKEEKPEQTSSHGGKMTQDQISAMFGKARGEEVEEKHHAPQGGVPGVVTQDQIAEMVKKAKKEKEDASLDNKDSVSDNGNTVDTSGTGSIKETLQKIHVEEQDSANKETTTVNETQNKPEEPSAPGGKMSQDQINEMIKKKQKETEEK